MCPSENPASHVIPGLSSQGLSPGLGLPVEGRALHARMRGYAFTGGSPPGPPGVPLPRMIMLCLGLRLALQRGRAERIPPRKPPLPSSPVFPRKATSPWLAPPGGAGSARPHARHHANPNIASFWPPASRQHVRSHDVPRLSPSLRSRTRRPCPSEKITLRVVPGLPPEAIVARILYPRRGRLRTPA